MLNPYRLAYGGHSKHLFRFLIRHLQPELVIEVGSRNGKDSLSFRAASPRAEIVAFEANPELFSKMKANPELAKKKIRVEPFAVSDSEGVRVFSIFNEERGTGSLHTRSNKDLKTTFEVQARRLDQLFDGSRYPRIGLWVDAEGHGYEVLEGARGLMSRVAFVQTEVEERALFEGQKLMSDIVSLMESQGFVAISGGIYPGRGQGDLLFLKRELAQNPGLILAYNRYRPFLGLSSLARRTDLKGRFPGLARLARSGLSRILPSPYERGK